MAKTKKEKLELLESYKKRIQGSKGLVMIKPNKLQPNETNEFRKEIFEFGAKFNIVKNSIFKIALKEEGLPEIESLNSGEHAVLFLGDDIVSPSKVLKRFATAAKTKEGDSKIEFIAGILEGAVLSSEDAANIADIPDKQGSISMILGILDNALAGVINVLEDAPKAYVSILDQAFKE